MAETPVEWANKEQITEFNLHNNTTKRVIVSEPLKHGEGSAAFASYLVMSDKQVRRRFQDFVGLHRYLCEAFPACIIPPLPGKHRMEYVTGDRFSPEFLEKRRASLQLFIDRINRHSILSTSPYYQKFLQADQMVLVSSSDHQAIGDTVRDSNVFDNIGEVFINAFTKVKTPDDKYVEMKEGIDKFENNLVNIEKIHVKMLKTQTELGHEFQLLGGAIESLGKMETQITEPLNEFGQGLLTYAQLYKDKVTAEDLDYCTGIHEFIAYCEAAKETLKLRDQKQVDFEELTRFLNANSSERDRTMSTGKSPGISGFFKDKINDFKGVDPEKARQERLSKLDAKIDDLKTAVNQSEETAQKFSTQVAQEFELFNNVKLYDFKELFRSYTDTQLAFHEKGAQFWESMLNVVDGIQIAPSPVVQE